VFNTPSCHTVGESRSAVVSGSPPGRDTNYNSVSRHGTTLYDLAEVLHLLPLQVYYSLGFMNRYT
jgi:hypothetical protein